MSRTEPYLLLDNLDIMRGIDSETIDLIYLDPPFNTKRNSDTKHLLYRLKG